MKRATKIFNHRSSGQRSGHRAGQRSGFTLIHMQVFIVVTGILMGLGVLWLSNAMKFSGRIRGQQRQHDLLIRLSRNLRADVQGCQSMRIENQARLMLTGPDGNTIEYQILDNQILMKEETGDIVRREAYTLNRKSQIKWDATGMPEAIGMIVTRPNLPNVPESVEAASADSKNEPGAGVGDTDWDKKPVDIFIQAKKSRWPDRLKAVALPAKKTGEKNDTAPLDSAESKDQKADQTSEDQTSEDQKADDGDSRNQGSEILKPAILKPAILEPANGSSKSTGGSK